MAMIGKVRRMHFREKKTVREIARATSLSRNTVRKYLRVERPEEPQYRRGPVLTKLTPFHEAIVQALKVDARRPKRERRTARALHEELRTAGYDGGYSRLTDFIRAWRQGQGQAANTMAFVPLTFELGEAFQFDWSEEGLVIAGGYRRVQLAHMKLCASRAFWLVAYPSQGHEMLFDAHTRGFAALGIARRGIYDNMKTAVDKVAKGKVDADMHRNLGFIEARKSRDAAPAAAPQEPARPKESAAAHAREDVAAEGAAATRSRRSPKSRAAA